MGKKVRVSIEVAETVTYHRYVEMDRAVYNDLIGRLQSRTKKVERRASDEISNYIDRRADVADSGDPEVTEFKLCAISPGSVKP